MRHKAMSANASAALAALACALCGARLGAADVQKAPIAFYHESFGVKQLSELRARYDFDEYVARGKDEFERMNLLKRWTYDTVTYGGAKQYTQLRNALTILEKAKRGEVFWCNNISAVYMQCALSLGYTSRYLFVRNTKGESHIVNDIWSNQYRKWVFMDPTWNVYLEKDGVPLSLPEMRAEWRKNGGADLVYVYGAGDNEKRFSKRDLPIKRDDNFLYRLWPVTDEWISFMYQVAMVGRNDLFTHEDGSGAYIWDTIYTIKDEANSKDAVWEFRRYPSPGEAALFHDLNRVDIKVEEAEGKPRIFLDAFGPSNYSPNFKAFEVRIDSGAWEEGGAVLAPALKGGKHTIQARVVNKFGVRGPITETQFKVKGGLLPFGWF